LDEEAARDLDANERIAAAALERAFPILGADGTFSRRSRERIVAARAGHGARMIAQIGGRIDQPGSAA